MEVNVGYEILGDSIFRHMCQRVSRNKYQWTYRNHGGQQYEHHKRVELAVSGQTIEQLRKRIVRGRATLSDYKVAKHVMLLIGTNDLLRGRPVNLIKKSLKRLLADLRKSGVRHVSLFTLPPCPALAGKDDIWATNDIIRSLHDGSFVHVVDACLEFINTEKSRPLYERDDVYPNFRGYRLLSDLCDQQRGKFLP